MLNDPECAVTPLAETTSYERDWIMKVFIIACIERFIC